MQELQQTHKDSGVSRFTVNKSDQPLVFVDVIHQALRDQDGVARGSVGGVPYSQPYRKGETYNMALAFADGHRFFKDLAHPAERYKDDQYLIWLVIDGAGAERWRKFVLIRNASGQYDMSFAPFG